MLPARLPKPCAQCGKSMMPRPKEGFEQFSARKFCGCGCYNAHRREHLSLRAQNVELYSIWNAMVQRCTNPKNRSWLNYGGRGISVCSEWQNFANFLRDMAPRPSCSTLDRIDNDAGYSKGNCRWVSVAQQNRNRRDNIYVGEGDGRLVLKDYCDKHGLNYSKTRGKIRYGRTVDEAIAEMEREAGDVTAS